MPYSTTGLNENEITIAELLKEKGYATSIFGKWHLGFQEKFLPLNHGFDTYLGLPYSNDMWPVDFDGNQISDSSDWRKKSYPQLMSHCHFIFIYLFRLACGGEMTVFIEQIN